MSNNKLYTIRFQNLDERKKIWKVLVEKFFQQFFSSTDRVLDVGCGFGEFINQVHCKERIGLDSDSSYRKFLAKGVKFLHGKSSKLLLSDNRVDKIFISNVFEHLTRKETVGTIKEFKRVLSSSGEVVVLQPNIRFCQKDYWMFFDHITPIDDRALDEVFASEGFVIRYKITKFLPFTTKSKLPKASVFIQLYLKFSLLWYFFGQQSLLIYRKEK